MPINPLVETLILYAVLFLPGVVSPGAAAGPLPFMAYQELIRILGYNVPAIALIWYLLRLRWMDKGLNGLTAWEMEIPDWDAPSLLTRSLRREDLYSFLLSVTGLFGIAVAISLISPLFPGGEESFILEAPRGAAAIVVMLLSCLSTGYLEEIYFRYYLAARFDATAYSPALRIGISVLLFSLCHVYEGPWGIINSALAGTLLCRIFSRYRTLHGIALAHACYNAIVFFTGQ